jgi:hypothetical protein
MFLLVYYVTNIVFLVRYAVLLISMPQHTRISWFIVRIYLQAVPKRVFYYCKNTALRKKWLPRAWGQGFDSRQEDRLLPSPPHTHTHTHTHTHILNKEQLSTETWTTHSETRSKSSPSWEANSFSASQKIPRILWNPKVHYRIHNSPLLVSFPIHINPVYAVHFNIILLLWKHTWSVTASHLVRKE